MARKKATPLDPLVATPAVREAAQALIQAVQDEAAERALTPKAYAKALKEVERLRGRPLLFPLIAGGVGRGARVWLADGTMKLDFIGGIGVYGLGHGDTDLLEHAVVASAQDAVFQGHLMPGPEYLRLSRALLRHAGPHLKHVWLSVSGVDANENALKMLLQKRAPADHIIVFERSFHGRTITMAELTDRPGFREGLPLRGNVHFVPFHDPDNPQSLQRSLEILDMHLKRYAGRVAGMAFELVQGEGGCHPAPREFFVALMERCREANVAVWVDEVQTFARTGELFAFRTLELDDYVDRVTAGKVLQGSATLYRRDFNPRPGLVAGTYAGSTVGMAIGARIIERLGEDGYLGPEGRIAVLGRRIQKRFESLARRLPKAVGPQTGVGAMQSFVPFDGSPDLAKAVLDTCIEEGLLLLAAGSNPSKIRMLPPVNTTDEELESGFAMLEKALRRVADEKELPC
ncbi:MAG: aminotransferase class III-fold pyridoxal phosphate-dependent enzyme [Proteobacteria bacterium]|nr:aminotransferase class III-fold pyridoxal phosphate-dependent enzyme [Pseudomonadota bacterium]